MQKKPGYLETASTAGTAAAAPTTGIDLISLALLVLALFPRTIALRHAVQLGRNFLFEKVIKFGDVCYQLIYKLHVNPRHTWPASRRMPMRSSALDQSSRVMNEMAIPLAPARPVLPACGQQKRKTLFILDNRLSWGHFFFFAIFLPSIWS